MIPRSLNKPERLRSNYRFRKVFKEGRAHKGRLLQLYILDNTLKINRIGIGIRRSCSKNNVQKNRLKRCLREVYRLNKGRLKQKGYDLILMPKKDLTARRSDINGLEEDFLNLIKKAGLIS